MDKKTLEKIEKSVKKSAKKITFDRNKPPPEAIDVGEVMRTPEMVEAVTKEIDAEIVDALHVAHMNRPPKIEKFYITAVKAVYCRKAGCALVEINVCRECPSYGGFVYRANGTDMDVICFEDSKDKAWDSIPAVKKGKNSV